MFLRCCARGRQTWSRPNLSQSWESSTWHTRGRRRFLVSCPRLRSISMFFMPQVVGGRKLVTRVTKPHPMPLFARKVVVTPLLMLVTPTRPSQGRMRTPAHSLPLAVTEASKPFDPILFTPWIRGKLAVGIFSIIIKPSVERETCVCVLQHRHYRRRRYNHTR